HGYSASPTAATTDRSLTPHAPAASPTDSPPPPHGTCSPTSARHVVARHSRTTLPAALRAAVSDVRRGPPLRAHQRPPASSSCLPGTTPNALQRDGGYQDRAGLSLGGSMRIAGLARDDVGAV